MTEAMAREIKSQGDQVARHPRLQNRGEPSGRRRHDLDRETHTEASTSGSPHSNQEENKSTLRKQGPPEPRPGEQKKKNGTFLNLNAFRRVKSPLVERRMAQNKRRGTTGTTVPMTRHGKEPTPSHNLQETSQARFF